MVPDYRGHNRWYEYQGGRGCGDVNGCYQGSARERVVLGRGVYHAPRCTDTYTVVGDGTEPDPIACLVAVLTVSREGGKLVSEWHRRSDGSTD